MGWASPSEGAKHASSLPLGTKIFSKRKNNPLTKRKSTQYQRPIMQLTTNRVKKYKNNGKR